MPANIHVVVSKETHSLLPIAKDEFKKHNKDLSNISLSNDFIIKRALDFYISARVVL